jgi:hypothetical protein
VRYFFNRPSPDVSSILLVESGSRAVLERVVQTLRRGYGPDIPIDLVTCFSTLPAGFDAASTRVFRVADYRGREGRRKLYRELRERQYSIAGVICSDEALMAKWKLAIALKIPAKLLIINENGDYFLFDRYHLRIIRRFVFLRAGLAGSGAVRTLIRAISFPFALSYLLLYATAIHARRALRRG